MVQGAVAAGLGYGIYRGISYVSEIIKKKQQAYRSEVQNMQLGQIREEVEEEKVIHIKLKSSKQEEKLEDTKREEQGILKQFIEAYSNDNDKRNGIAELVIRFKMILSNIENKKGTKAINTTNQNFQLLILSNNLADDMMKSLGFVKKESFYEYESEDTKELKSAISYLEELV